MELSNDLFGVLAGARHIQRASGRDMVSPIGGMSGASGIRVPVVTPSAQLSLSDERGDAAGRRSGWARARQRRQSPPLLPL